MSVANITLIFFGISGACGVWFGLLFKEEIYARRFFTRGADRSGRMFFWNKKSDQWKCFQEFPDFLELLALALSSGSTLGRAWEDALRFMPDGPLRLELRRTSNDFSLGRARIEAIRALVARLNDDRLSGTLALLCHALKYGTPMEGILLEQAGRLRGAVLMALEKRAQTASLRLLFPLVLFILPTIFIILFGPLVLGFIETGRLF